MRGAFGTRIHQGSTSAVVDVNAGFVYWLHVRAGTAKTSVTLRDGSNTGSRELTSHEIDASPSRMIQFDPPMPYEEGLFVEADANTASFTVMYGPRGHHEGE